jgi:4-oxalocrotonate tautomerase
MPLINVRLIEGVFSDSQKQQIIERLTDAMVSIEGESLRPVTWCVVDEVKSGDWGIGGSRPDRRGRARSGRRPAGRLAALALHCL